MSNLSKIISTQNGFRLVVKLRSTLGKILLVLLFLFSFAACRTPFNQPQTPSASQTAVSKSKKTTNARLSSEKRLRRKRISVSRNLYEGSLWRYESSFGNILRDHRARFRGDLMTISELPAVVNVAEPKAEAEGEAAAPTNDTQRASLLLEAITMRDEIENEQNDILRSLETISARVTKVLPDGNMLIKGQKIDYRQRNQVRYITTITGILRPADVDDSNIVSATKLANPNVKIKRQQSGTFIRERLQKLAPLVGQQKAGLLGRLGDFAKQ
ncbi:MAG: flagellar basal body L-ring protein FlgH [SAR324 cluster bacterium]|nr:flagellar biosynthesis protein FlgH [Pseudomonadota bacterium]MDP6638378.1 flagellar basal body L-ring protein FlgH [SAR324 cluster bacterium]